MLNFKSLIIASLIFGSFAASALEAGPYILSGNVTKSDSKMVTLDLGEQNADVPAKLIPKSQKVETGKKLTLAFTEEQSKQIKIYKK